MWLTRGFMKFHDVKQEEVAQRVERWVNGGFDNLKRMILVFNCTEIDVNYSNKK
jgi:hypothetical protein